jgi:hypothetical protein
MKLKVQRKPAVASLKHEYIYTQEVTKTKKPHEQEHVSWPGFEHVASRSGDMSTNHSRRNSRARERCLKSFNSRKFVSLAQTVSKLLLASRCMLLSLNSLLSVTHLLFHPGCAATSCDNMPATCRNEFGNEMVQHSDPVVVCC